jgi:flagellar M-ring protein FliF
MQLDGGGENPTNPGKQKKETAMAPSAAALPLSLQGFNQLSTQQKLIALVGAAALVAVLAAAWLWARQPSYSVLFSNLSDRDGGAIIAALQQQNVPYRFAEGGAAILVPTSQVHDARLRLASQGLPKGGSVGFELMESQKLGISQFAEQVNYQRALEGELARSIQSLAAVQGARVHLAIPRQTGFLRDEQKPTASVLVNLYAGRNVDAGQVAGIVHLVSSSVPSLSADRVTVVDQNGNLLSTLRDSLHTAGLDPSQIKYVQEIEASYIRRIESILSPITGAGNVRAQVAADVDFSQAEQTAESYKPNGTPDNASVRSQQSSESMSRDAGPAGIPGALSNQPPAPASAPITAGPGVSPGQTSTAPTVVPPLNSRKESTVNYELDKTIKHVRQPVGAVKRLSVAVVVNHKRVPDAAGKSVAKPYSDAEMRQIGDLTREAMGFSKERGDTLNIANTPFDSGQKATAAAEAPVWQDPSLISLAKDLGGYLALGGLGAYLFFGVARPYLRDLARHAEAARQARGVTRDDDDILSVHGGAAALSYDQKLLGARELAKQDPKLVANVIKGWVGGNER